MSIVNNILILKINRQDLPTWDMKALGKKNVDLFPAELKGPLFCWGHRYIRLLARCFFSEVVRKYLLALATLADEIAAPLPTIQQFL